MNTRVASMIVLALLTVECGHQDIQPIAPIITPPPMAAPKPVLASPPPPPAQIAVVAHFDKVTKRELSVVLLEPGMTRERIAQINESDHAARVALSMLGKQHNQITHDALVAAQTAVRQLEKALDGEQAPP